MFLASAAPPVTSTAAATIASKRATLLTFLLLA
jgi:hypothetical protein